MSLQADALKVAEAVDRDRLWRRHETMAGFGARADGGVNRAALSAEDIAARAELLGWAKALDLELAVDDIANLYLRRPGRDREAPPVLTGSHMDSQPAGGRFDGIYGVLAGLEALEAMAAAGVTTKRPVELVAWTNEEGGRYAPGAMGSAVFAGDRQMAEFDDLVDAEGIRFVDALRDTLAATPDLPRRPFAFPAAGYIEAHIEQGPLLEAKGVSIGVVSGIQGARWFTVTVSGDSAHAGTTPLSVRRDALREAVAVIQALQALMADPEDVVRFTVAKMEVEPNSPNSIASKVTFSVDFRHPDAAILGRLGDSIPEVAEAAVSACTVTVQETLTHAPCVFDPVITAAIDGAAEALGHSRLSMPSGAFHDAQFMSALCPTGMIFVPCEKGISHNPTENAKPDDLAAGARVLAASLVELANR